MQSENKAIKIDRMIIVKNMKQRLTLFYTRSKGLLNQFSIVEMPADTDNLLFFHQRKLSIDHFKDLDDRGKDFRFYNY